MRVSLTLSGADGSDELFNRAMILHARRGLDPAANIDRLWRDSRNGMRDVSRI